MKLGANPGAYYLFVFAAVLIAPSFAFAWGPKGHRIVALIAEAHVGTVKSMIIDPDNSLLVRVDVRLRKETPVKTDTRASLVLKGITGGVFIELNGGDPAAQTLRAVTPQDKIPEIPSEKTGLKAMLDELPKLVGKFSAIEDQIKKVLTGVGALTDKVKDKPSLLLRGPEK